MAGCGHSSVFVVIPVLVACLGPSAGATATSEIGGAATDGHDDVQATVAVYDGCLAYNVDDTNSVTCRYRGLRPSREPYSSTLYGYVTKTHNSGSQALFWGCVDPSYSEYGSVTGCAAYGLRATADAWGYSKLIGYTATDDSESTRPMYNGCLEIQQTADGQFFCAVSGLRPTPDPWGWSSLVGHVYRDHRRRA